MKRVYFAGKFNLGKGKTLAEKLTNDYRSIILGDSRKLTYAQKDLQLKNFKIIYNGCFYCEQASNGDYTSTDCETVVTEETNQVLSSDIFLCVLDTSFSVGTIVELMDAVKAKKQIAIFYKNEATSYKIKSEYWFAITRATQIAKENGTKIEIFSYDDNLIDKLNNYLKNLQK